MQRKYLFALLLMCLASLTQAQEPQTKTDALSRWYIGVDAGASVGHGTFTSFGADKTRIGYGIGLLGGYHLNPYLSVETEFKFSSLGMSAYDCCTNLYLASNGNRYFAPLAGATNHRYGDLYSTVNLYQLGVHLNIDFVRMFKPQSRWSLLLSPAVYGIGSQATVKTIQGEATVLKGDNQTHIGMGGDLGVGYQVSPRVNLRLYSGLTYITGKGIDALPQTEHKSNYTWNSGLKVTFTLGKRSTPKQQPMIEPVVSTSPRPVAKPEPTVVVQEPKKEEVVEPRPIVTPVEVAVPKETILFEAPIYFSVDQCEYIEQSQYPITVELLKALADSPETRVSVIGWADKTGAEARNEFISARRAETVKRYLIHKGIAADRIFVEGKGVDNRSTSDDKARRADIRVIIIEK